jgi:hypothetical protein
MTAKDMQRFRNIPPYLHLLRPVNLEDKREEAKAEEDAEGRCVRACMCMGRMHGQDAWAGCMGMMRGRFHSLSDASYGVLDACLRTPEKRPAPVRTRYRTI